METLSLQAPYSLLFVGDPEGQVPLPIERPITVGVELVAVGTLMSQDGATGVRLHGEGEPRDVPSGSSVVFHGVLALPSKALGVSNAEHEIYWLTPAFSGRASVVIATNDPAEPDVIDIWYRREDM